MTSSSMLPGAPWLLAHRSMLPVNQPKKVSLYGQDYVLWQDATGQIAALPNRCAHMGAMLSEGWCEANPNGGSDVVCPFHALSFDAQGCTVLPGSNRKTLPQVQPLELIIRDDFVWSYGGHEPQQPIPAVLNEIAQNYHFLGAVADTSVETDLLTMLLNMHDYNHQNGTHRELFRIQSVDALRFSDNGHHSEAFYSMPRAKTGWLEKLKNPALLAIPKVIDAHLENIFPSMVIFHGTSAVGKAAQCHLFVPEGEGRTRTYVLLYVQTQNRLAPLLKHSFLKLPQVVVEQDVDILNKLYPDAPQRIRLNNEVGMDWVRRNFKHWPHATVTKSTSSA